MREPLWTSREVALCLLSDATQPWYADGLQTDSRDVMPGDMFIALKGPTFDGHTYVEEAFTRGAVAAVVEKGAHTYEGSKPVVEVRDTLKALEALATAARDRAPASVIGVTGSAGKTTLVQMLRRAFEGKAPTHASIKSYNNHIGVPLSVARMGRETRFGIFEMGMNHAGEIKARSQLVKPDSAIITAVGAAHRQHFSSIEDIARAKAEIFTGVRPGGTAIVGLGLEQGHGHEEILLAAARQQGLETVTVGLGEGAQVRPLAVHASGTASEVTASIFGSRVSYHINQPGDMWIYNSLLMLAGVKVAGGDLSVAALTLGQMAAEVGRGRLHELHFECGDMQLIDDSYNANPLSLAASLSRLALMTPRAGTGRRIAVLGDMEELGPDSLEYHLRLAPDLRKCGADMIYAVGAMSQALGRAAGVETRRALSETALAEELVAGLRHGDIVLVKGSNKAGLGRVVQDILARAGRELAQTQAAINIAE